MGDDDEDIIKDGIVRRIAVSPAMVALVDEWRKEGENGFLAVPPEVAAFIAAWREGDRLLLEGEGPNRGGGGLLGDAQRCRDCGCSWFRPCKPPCHWVLPDLCSNCHATNRVQGILVPLHAAAAAALFFGELPEATTCKESLRVPPEAAAFVQAWREEKTVPHFRAAVAALFFGDLPVIPNEPIPIERHLPPRHAQQPKPVVHKPTMKQERRAKQRAAKKARRITRNA